MDPERLDKVRRFYFLENMICFLGDVHYALKINSKGFEDFVFLRKDLEREIGPLLLDLYPDPPINLWEDLKRREEQLKKFKNKDEGFSFLGFFRKGFKLLKKSL